MNLKTILSMAFAMLTLTFTIASVSSGGTKGLNCPLFQMEQSDNIVSSVFPAPTATAIDEASAVIDFIFTNTIPADIAAEKYDEEYGLFDNPLKLLTNSAAASFLNNYASTSAV